MLHDDGNVDKKFFISILNGSRENHTSLIAILTDLRTLWQFFFDFDNIVIIFRDVLFREGSAVKSAVIALLYKIVFFFMYVLSKNSVAILFC